MAAERQINRARLFCALLLCCVSLFAGGEMRSEVRIGRMKGDSGLYGGSYPGALNSLLSHVAAAANINIATEPVELPDFSDSRLCECPYIYANYLERKNWKFTDAEKAALKNYLENGGFIHLDAGITASFLREIPGMGQHHSYGEWEAAPEIREAFAEIFPGKNFVPVKRSDPLFRVFYKGLPDTSLLPDTVREYTEKEKWPDGTYSAVALKINGRIAVLCTPVIAMGWGRNSMGQWQTMIRFRVLEGTETLGDVLEKAPYSGPKFEVVREDGAKDIVYCQDRAQPAWVNEPDGRWRVFRYYSSREISDFAHVFYTRLATNFIVYALAQ